MKLLLTSSGIDNHTVARALQQLTGKPADETKIGFVPTAINAEHGSKDWAINQFIKLWRHGYNWIDIIDPSAAGINWQERLEACDAIFLSGGNTFHLLDQTRKTGLDKWMNDNKKKIFIGSSAGSILFAPTIGIAATGHGDTNYAGIKDITGLEWVDFEIAPHYENKVTKHIVDYSKIVKNPIYAIDDQTAIKVDGDKIKVVSEGFWKLYNA
jgi:dipeptidase E